MTVSEVWDGMSASGVGAEGTELSIRHRTRGLGSVFSCPGNLSRPFTLLHPCDLIRSILTFLMNFELYLTQIIEGATNIKRSLLVKTAFL